MASIQEALAGRRAGTIKKLTSGFDVDPGKGVNIISETALEAKKIPFDSLSVSPANTYSVNADEVQELSDSISSIGLLDYPVVEMVSIHSYEILSGQKRYLAIKLLKENDPARFSSLFPEGKIPCKVVDLAHFQVYGTGDMSRVDPSVKRTWIIASGNQQHEKTVADLILQVEQLTDVYQELKSKGLVTTGKRQREFIAENSSLQSRSVQRVVTAKKQMLPELWNVVKMYPGLTSVRQLVALSELPQKEQGTLASEINAGHGPSLETFLSNDLGDGQFRQEPPGNPPKDNPTALGEERPLYDSHGDIVLDGERLESFFMVQSFARTARMITNEVHITGADAKKLEDIGIKLEKLRRSAEKILKKYKTQEP